MKINKVSKTGREKGTLKVETYQPPASICHHVAVDYKWFTIDFRMYVVNPASYGVTTRLQQQLNIVTISRNARTITCHCLIHEIKENIL